MAQYKVPQDVEADDKLLGPFGFRQFCYLLIAAALLAIAWALSRLFALLAIFPILPAAFFLILALPLRKDQPMETYIIALWNFYTKPNKRFWNPGQRESTIKITAPKIVEKSLTKNITEEEAGRRLSFLANVVDSEGLSIKGGAFATTPSSSPVREEFLAEANSAPDMFENYRSTTITDGVAAEDARRHAEAVESMRAAISEAHPISLSDTGVWSEPPVSPRPGEHVLPAAPPSVNPATVVAPSLSDLSANSSASSSSPDSPSIPMTETPPAPPNPAFRELSHNSDYSVATIAKEARRKATKPKEKEVYISLH